MCTSDLEPIDVGALYLLARPSTLQEVRDEALGRTRNGDKDVIERKLQRLAGSI
jgi:hypothetical protein